MGWLKYSPTCGAVGILPMGPCLAVFSPVESGAVPGSIGQECFSADAFHSGDIAPVNILDYMNRTRQIGATPYLARTPVMFNTNLMEEVCEWYSHGRQPRIP
jgi:hypothetical protein